MLTLRRKGSGRATDHLVWILAFGSCSEDPRAPKGHSYRKYVFSHVQLFVTPWTVAHQAPLSIVFSRQEYWSGLPCLASGDLPDSGTDTFSWQADSLPLVPPRKPFIRLGPTQIQYDLI